jgi:small subunit ribosomal protein S19
MADMTMRGYTPEQIKNMSVDEFIKIVPARLRRSLKRGFTPQQKILLKRVNAELISVKSGKEVKMIKTHCRDMVILPNMLGLILGVHDGREFIRVDIIPERLGHVLGEFTYNRKRVQHHAPGVGATRGSTFVPIK